MTTTEFFADHRRRNLAVLAAIAVLTTLLALFAVHVENSESAPRYAPTTFFPNLAYQLRNAARLHIESKKGAFDVTFTPGKGWVIPQHGNYPASLDQIRQTLVSLAALETIEPKTSRPDWMHYLDLDPPPRGNAVHLSVYDSGGNTLAALFIGKSEDIGDPGGAIGLFVRKDGDPQSWLVNSPFAPQSDPADWLDKTVVDVDRARIQDVDVTPANGPSYSVSRVRPSDPDFTLSPISNGREIANVAAPDGVASSIANFTFADVAPAAKFDVSHATKLVTKTFDGLTVTAQVVQQGADAWAVLSADAAPGNLNTQKEARDINARAAGWAYKLPPDKAQQFLTTLESMLKPAGAPATTGQ